MPGGLCGNGSWRWLEKCTFELLLGAVVGNGRIALVADGDGGGPRRRAVLYAIDCSDDAVVRLEEGVEEDEVFMFEAVGEGGGDLFSYDSLDCASTQSAVRSSEDEWFAAKVL